MTEQEDALLRLRQAVEEKIGRRIQVHGDFEHLAAQIFEEQHQTISPTTLKRLWGYLSEEVMPRQSTLDILSRFVGSPDWETFCRQSSSPSNTVPPRKARYSFAALSLPLLLILTVAFLWHRRVSGQASPADERYVLRMGQTFASYGDYLRLFGVMAEDTLWWQSLPHHPNVRLWGPLYHHPEWHNDGNADSLMPTIAEYWEPEGFTDNPENRELIRRMNRNGYAVSRRINEVRLTFMKGLPTTDSTTLSGQAAVDTGFVFLGVYRMSLTLSDTCRIVWERVADEVDLRNLDYLEQYRN